MNQLDNQKLYYEYILNKHKVAGCHLSMDNYQQSIKKYAKVSLLCLMASLACLFSKNKIVKAAPTPFTMVALAQLGRYKSKEKKCKKSLTALELERQQLLKKMATK